MFIRKTLRAIYHFLISEKMPIWLTLASGIAVAAGTYYLAPKINVIFEQEKIRSAYLLENLKNLNTDTSQLLSLVGRFNNKAIRQDEIDQETREKILEQITVFQWRVIEYNIIFSAEKSVKYIRDYQESLDSMRRAIDAVKQREDINDVNVYVREFTRSSHQLLRLLSNEAGFELSVQPTNMDNLESAE